MEVIFLESSVGTNDFITSELIPRKTKNGKSRKFLTKYCLKKQKKKIKRNQNILLYGFRISNRGLFNCRKNYNGNIFDISRNYAVWMVITWAIFSYCLWHLPFVPYFNNWEEKKKQNN